MSTSRRTQPPSSQLLSNTEYADHLDNDFADAEQFLADAEEDVHHATYAKTQATKHHEFHEQIQHMATKKDAVVVAHARTRAQTERVANPKIEQIIYQQKGGRAGVLAEHKMRTERWNDSEPSRMISSMTAYERELEAAEQMQRERRKDERRKKREEAASVPTSPCSSPPSTSRVASSSTPSTPSLFCSQPTRTTAIAEAAAHVAIAIQSKKKTNNTYESSTSSTSPTSTSSSSPLEHVRSSAIKGSTSTRAYRALTHALPEQHHHIKQSMTPRGGIHTYQEDDSIPPPPPEEEDDDTPPPPPPSTSRKSRH